MSLLAWVDGVVVDASTLRCDVPYVMQRIHTLGGRPRSVARHLALLNEAAEYLFGLATLCRVADAERIIARLLEVSHANASFSYPVAMRLDCRGLLSFEVEPPTFGRGYYLRAKRLHGEVLEGVTTDTVAQSSVSVALDAMAESRVAVRGGECAVLVDERRMLISRPWLPIFAVYGSRVYTPVEHRSVEFITARRAIERLGMELVVRPLSEEVLERVEELFVVDIMGVSAYADIRQHSLLSAVAKRIAEAIESN